MPDLWNVACHQHPTVEPCRYGRRRDEREAGEKVHREDETEREQSSDAH